MNGFMNGAWNPNNQNFMPNNYMQPNFNLPRYEIIKVNGEAGAKNFRMAPNSSALLLDETAPIVWLVQTDGAGYSTPIAYDIVLHQPTPQVNINDLAQRVAQLEDIINAKQSNSQSNKQPKRQQSNANVAPNTSAAV